MVWSAKIYFGKHPKLAPAVCSNSFYYIVPQIPYMLPKCTSISVRSVQLNQGNWFGFANVILSSNHAALFEAVIAEISKWMPRLICSFPRNISKLPHCKSYSACMCFGYFQNYSFHIDRLTVINITYLGKRWDRRSSRSTSAYGTIWHMSC